LDSTPTRVKESAVKKVFNLAEMKDSDREIIFYLNV